MSITSVIENGHTFGDWEAYYETYGDVQTADEKGMEFNE